MLCALIANVNRNPRKRPRPFEPKDFMPRKASPAMTDEQMLEKVKLINIALGGKER